MTYKHHGGIDSLKELVAKSDIPGNWSLDGEKHVFRSHDRGVLNFWPSSNTVQIQGKNEARAKLSEALKRCSEPAVPETTETGHCNQTKIFIVHGHDADALDQLELVLLRLDLKPYILQNNDGGGSTIIEALEQQIYREAAFGIVLMTPDDYGYPKTKEDKDREPRSRQNVVLEMGMVLASLGRDRMAILKKGTLELPSDVEGVIRLDFNDDVREVAIKLVDRMKNAGIQIDDRLIAKVVK